MSENVDPSIHCIADVLGTVNVGVHLQVVLVGNFYDSLVGFQAHRVGLDQVDSGLCQPLRGGGSLLRGLRLDLKRRHGRG